MEPDESEPRLPQFTLKPRREINAALADLATLKPLDEKYNLILAEPAASEVDLIVWAGANQDRIQSILLRHGAILFRGFNLKSATEFEKFIRVNSKQLLPYLERSTPRKQISGYIYSSTEYPPEHSIFLHCENSYQRTWPLKIFFYCETPALQGGETPVGDTRRILHRIAPSVRKKFLQKGVLYTRNYRNGLGLSWQTVFQSEDKRDVEQYCLNAGIEYQWYGDDQLRTRQIRKAIQAHPVTGEEVWFNHAVFFHVTTLTPVTQRILKAGLSDEEFPNNTYYGDGAQIEPYVLDHLREVYCEETVSFPWRRGDILMLDNMLMAHGRSSFTGTRAVWVGMADPYGA